MAKTIELTQGKYAIVDDEDYEYLNRFDWYYNANYAIRSVRINRKKKAVLMHRVILNTPEGMLSDHINHDTLDNRKINLRICTRAQNGMNSYKSKHNKSGFKGVHKFRDKYRAQITFNKKVKTLGFFETTIEAAQIYNKAALKYHGEFAQLNEIV